MKELISMIGVRGNITAEEQRKLSAKRAKATQGRRDRIDDGRAYLQRQVLSFMQENPGAWFTCAELASILSRRAQAIHFAMRRLERAGLVSCSMHTTPVHHRDGVCTMRPIKHFSLTERGLKK